MPLTDHWLLKCLQKYLFYCFIVFLYNKQSTEENKCLWCRHKSQQPKKCHIGYLDKHLKWPSKDLCKSKQSIQVCTLFNLCFTVVTRKINNSLNSLMTNIVIKMKRFSEGLAGAEEAEIPFAIFFFIFLFAQDLRLRSNCSEFTHKNQSNVFRSNGIKRFLKPENRWKAKFPVSIFLNLQTFFSHQMTQRQV